MVAPGFPHLGCELRKISRSAQKVSDPASFLTALQALLTLLLLTSTAAAQLSSFEGKRIVEVQFSPPSRLDPRDLARVQPLKKGEPLRGEDVARAIDGLFSTGRFEDIVAEAESSGDGVMVRFVTKNTWFVGGVTVDGKVVIPPNRGQIASTAQLNLGAPFREEDVNHAVDGIKRLLQANGFYAAEVTPEVERDNHAQEVFLRFRVREHKRARYEMPIIQGDTKLSNGTIVRATGWRIPLIHWWRQVTEERTRKGGQGVLAKYQKQDRLTAQVELQKMDYDAKRRRVRPTLIANAGPRVEIRAIETKVSRRVLKRYVPVFQERAVDNDLLVEGKRNLTSYFQNKGYYNVEVDLRVLPPQKDLQVIEYAIARGQRQKVVHVAINGNHYFSTGDIRERMFVQPASFNLRHGRYSEAFRHKDEENIANLYRANGFRDVKITSTVDRNYRGKSGQVAVTFNVNEGPQWMVENLTVNGVTQVDRKDLMAGFASAPGQPFADVNLASDRNYVLTYYYSRGFPRAAFRANWEPAGTPNHVNVIYTVSEGERQYVRDVIISGLHTTRQKLVDKTMTLHAGDPLSPVEQTEIQKRLYNLGIFARVDTAIENPEGNTGHKYVLYSFEEANRYRLNLGFGADVARFGKPSTQTIANPGGKTGFSPMVSLDVSRLNFLGLGHMVTLRGMYSSLEKLASLSYLAPRFRNVEGQNITVTTLFDQSLNVVTFASRREEASIQLSQKFSKPTTGLFRFAYRRVSVSSVNIPVLLVPQLLQPVRIAMLSANLSQDRRDNPADPHRGMFNTADIGLSARFFGSQRSFGRALLRNATYYRLTNSIVFARQIQFGVISPFAAPRGLTEQQSVPLPERFFGGGPDSLRAFPFNQAGPRDTGAPVVPNGPSSKPSGYPLGGNALFFNNIELRFPFIGSNIQGVIFHDMGNVFSTLSNTSLRFHQRNLQDFDYTVHAVGYGIRYRTPVGPIRVDLAYSINPPSYFGFNESVCNATSIPIPNLQPCTLGQRRISHFQFFFSIGQTF